MVDIHTIRVDERAPKMSEAEFLAAIDRLGKGVRSDIQGFQRVNCIAPDAARARGTLITEVGKMIPDAHMAVWRKLPSVGTRREDKDIVLVAQAEFIVVPRE